MWGATYISYPFQKTLLVQPMFKNYVGKHPLQNRTNVQIKGGGGQRPFEQCSKKLHFSWRMASLRSLCLWFGHSHHSLAPKLLFHPTTAFPGALLQAAAILGQMASAAFFGIFSKPTLVRCFQCGRTRSVIMMNCRADGPLHTNAFCGRPKKRLFGLE